MGVLSLLYAVLLGAFYLFITTREASVWQLLVTIMLAVAVPLLFFVLQAGSARAALGFKIVSFEFRVKGNLSFNSKLET